MLELAALASMGITGCQNNMDTPDPEVPKASYVPNISIAELKETFWQSDDNYAILVPEREDGSHYIISGRVISSDASGNIYKALYIQDETAAITISINQNSLYNEYRLGQQVMIDVTGLYIGKYAGLQQIGGYGEYNGAGEVSFMMYPRFTEHTQLNGLPLQDVTYVEWGDDYPDSGMYCNIIKISDLDSSPAGLRMLQSQLVELRNVYFEKGGEEPFSTYQNTENKILRDEEGNSIIVRTSGYSNFYHNIMPEGTGTIRGMLSYNNSKWQIILRDYNDVMFTSKGSQSDPYTITEAIEYQNDGYNGWVNGYIVGSVKAGVTSVDASDDVIWSADAEMDNTLVLGPDVDCKDLSKCIVINLPQGSDLRKYGNLADNPENYGKEILVRGSLGEYMGTYGLIVSRGTASDFEIEGVTIEPEPEQPIGDGTEANPYSVAYVQSSSADNVQKGVWVEGWVVGFVKSGSSNEFRFNNDMTGIEDSATAGYNGSNLVLGSSRDANTEAQCIPVQVPVAVRDFLGLRQNPSVYLTHVKLKGDIEKNYFLKRGLRNVSEYKVIE